MFGKPGSILLCIGDLPTGISRTDLKSFVLAALRPSLKRSIRAGTAISDCLILRLTHPQTGEITHQGLIAVQPAKIALDLIEILPRLPLSGRRMRVYRYRHGSFEVGTANETKSIGDLLGIKGTDQIAEMPLYRLDLVDHTGDSTHRTTDRAIAWPVTRDAERAISATAGQAKPPTSQDQSSANGAFAH